jgi:DNA-binding GntR family transcriptional regulator
MEQLMKPIFHGLESATLSDRIFRHVQEAIMNGTLAPGERIHADALARQFKVSHIPVREALTHLEAVGLIVQEPHKGARVIEVSPDDIRHIFEIRKILEGLAVRLAAANIDEQGKKRLQALVDEIGQAAKAKDFLKMDTADQEFHRTIWRTSGNPYLYKILLNLLSPYFGFLASKGYYFRRKQLNSVSEVHQSILDAIARGDGLEAQETIIRVHNRTANLLLKG